MIEQGRQQVAIDKREWLGCLTIGKDWYKDFTGKEADHTDALAEQKLVELGRLIRDFGLGRYIKTKKGA